MAALGKQKQEGFYEFRDSQAYTVRPCHKKTKQKKKSKQNTAQYIEDKTKSVQSDLFITSQLILMYVISFVPKIRRQQRRYFHPHLKKKTCLDIELG